VRVGVISDIHSNLCALEAVLDDLGSVDALWCLGDVVGYAAEPNECVERLRQVGAVCIQGNHDLAALGEVSLAYFNSDAAAAARWTAQVLTPESRAWLAACPQVLTIGDATLVHGSPCFPVWEYVTTARVAARALAACETPLCLIGHTHVPSSFVEQADGTVRAEYRQADDVLALGAQRLLANPGSVGQPRDEDPRAAYLVLDTDAGTLAWHRVPYAVRVTQERILRAGLPPRLAYRLAAGL